MEPHASLLLMKIHKIVLEECITSTRVFKYMPNIQVFQTKDKNINEIHNLTTYYINRIIVQLDIFEKIIDFDLSFW
jgi:hypothetical protein